MQRMVAAVLVIMIAGISMAPAAQSGGRSGAGDRSEALDNASNGQPVEGKIDAQAVEKLESAWALMEEQDQDRPALEAAQALVATFEQNQDYTHLVDCLYLIGHAYYNLGEWSSALSYTQRAWDLGTRYFDDEMNSFPLKIIGECQFELGNSDEALGAFTLRAQRLRKEQTLGELPVALFDLGTMLVGLDRIEEGLVNLKDGLVASDALLAELDKPGSTATPHEKTDALLTQAELTYYTAVANSKLSQLTQCRTYLQQALVLFNAIQAAGDEDVTDRLVAVLDDLVWCCEQLADTAAAEQYRGQRDTLNQ